MNRKVQGYLDGTMSRTERTAFEEELRSESPALLKALRVLAAKPVVADEAEPTPWFTERVMARLAEREERWPARLRRAWLTPRIRPATALAAMALTALIAATVAVRSRPQAPAAAAEPQGSAVQIVLRLSAPGAKHVNAVGDFNGWSKQATPLVPAGDGEWVARVRLAPGVYQYTFLVDGKEWVVDPNAGETVDDGFGNRNAVLKL